MRLGVVGLMPKSLYEVDASVAARIRAAGFTGVTVLLPDPLGAEEQTLQRVRATLAEAGVRVAQANPQYERLVNPNDERRREGIRTLQRACRCARWLGSNNVYVRPGGLNPKGPWFPHPLNTDPRTLDRLIDSLKQVVPAAEDEGVKLALEAHVLSPLDTLERTREVIQAVGSPVLGFNADPVNLIGTLADAYDSSSFLQRMFALLGEYVVCAHLKDYRVEDRLVLHIAECVPGEGLFDTAGFLQLFDAHCPDGFALIEHLPDDDIPRAKQTLDLAAATAGLAWME